MTPRPIALDWGTRSLRARLLDGTGAALGLVGQLAPEDAASHLSGLLTGEEARAAASGSGGPRVTLIGDPVLCERHRGVLAAAGRGVHVAPPDPATIGLRRMAVASGRAGRGSSGEDSSG